MRLNNVVHKINQFNPKEYSYSEIYSTLDSEVNVNGLNLYIPKGVNVTINVLDLDLVYGNVFLLGFKLTKESNKQPIIFTSRNINVSDTENILHYNDDGFIDLGYGTFLTI